MEKRKNSKKKFITDALQKIKLPKEKSHKGQNGKLLIIGGSKLFHCASKWSLDVASRFVDMVFYCSTPQNNALIKEAKQNFNNGIVIERNDIENYIKEADCILIGPGMERSGEFKDLASSNLNNDFSRPNDSEWQNNTEKIVNYLVNKYPQKKWVIDGGALQMINPSLINKRCILTPHNKEFDLLVKKTSEHLTNFKTNERKSNEQLLKLSATLNGATIIKKGHVDFIVSQNKSEEIDLSNLFTIEGGNAGMIKGGTGDVLAGLVAALYCTHDAITSSIVGSYINKKTGDTLFKKVGPFFNASDLADQIAPTMWSELKNL